MRKLCLLLIFTITLIVPWGAEAQAPSEENLQVTKQKIDIGIRLGMTLSSVTGDLRSASDPRFGFGGGVFTRIPIHERILLQPELIYSMQGARNEHDHDIATELSYLNLPVLASFKILKDADLYGHIGPQLGFLLNGEMDSDRGEGEMDIEDDLKNFDFGVVVGAGYYFNSGFGVDVRYNIGLTDINNSGTSSDEIRNSVFFTSVSYTF